MTTLLKNYPLLANINFPEDMRKLATDQLPQVSEELRRYLLDSVSQSSGHFASGLGTIELTVALHYVYQTPFDHLIWDVGHQAYPHKILLADETNYIPSGRKMACTLFLGVKKVNTTF
jgi:1-deoxy-D-xylulose-5-phosphate synthase